MPDVAYSKDMEPGNGVFKVWHFGYTPEYGNSGLVPLEDMRSLICLICARGFKTDSDMAGVEKIVACSATETLLGVPLITADVDVSVIPALSLMEVKGWKRINAAWFIIVVVMKLNLIEDMKLQEEIYDSFRAVFANVKDNANHEELIFANREVGHV